MSDNKESLGFQDDSKINMNEPYEVNYACQMWGVTKPELEDAIKAVGNGRQKVEEWLRENGFISNRNT